MVDCCGQRLVHQAFPRACAGNHNHIFPGRGLRRHPFPYSIEFFVADHNVCTCDPSHNPIPASSSLSSFALLMLTGPVLHEPSYQTATLFQMVRSGVEQPAERVGLVVISFLFDLGTNGRMQPGVMALGNLAWCPSTVASTLLARNCPED